MLFVASFPSATLLSVARTSRVGQVRLTAGLGTSRNNSPFLEMIAAVKHYEVLVLPQLLGLCLKMGGGLLMKLCDQGT